MSDADDIFREFKNAILVRNVVARISGHQVISMEHSSDEALKKSLHELLKKAGDEGTSGKK